MKDNELERLLACARAGDPQARKALLSHLWQQAHNRAEATLRPALLVQEGASDVAQKACLRAHNAFLQFRGETAAELRAWFGKIVRNLLIDIGRAHGSKVDREEAGEDRLEALVDDGTSPSQHVLRAEQEARLQVALLRLPQRQQEVFRMRFVEQLPFAEVANRLGVTEVHARVLFLRAVEWLRDELGESA